jgi:hypothetical protein
MSMVQSGQAAPPGVYVSLKPLDLRVVSGADSVLGGLPGASYRRYPLATVVILGPVFGGVFAMSLPFMVFLAFGNAVREYLAGFRTYRAGEIAKWGVYLGYNRPALAHVTATGARIEGRAGTRYIRLPSLLVVLFSPLLGLLYIMVFPILLAVATLTVLLHLLMRLIGKRPPGPAWPFTSASSSERDRGAS